MKYQETSFGLPLPTTAYIYIYIYIYIYYLWLTFNSTLLLFVGKEEKIETPILLAAKNGIKEMVVKILEDIPMAINDEDNNIVLLAAKNRQTHVLRELFKKDLVKCKLIHEVDANGNNALHLAAELGEQEPWVIPGAALQMQWEIKWYEV